MFSYAAYICTLAHTTEADRLLCRQMYLARFIAFFVGEKSLLLIRLLSFRSVPVH